MDRHIRYDDLGGYFLQRQEQGEARMKSWVDERIKLATYAWDTQDIEAMGDQLQLLEGFETALQPLGWMGGEVAMVATRVARHAAAEGEYLRKNIQAVIARRVSERAGMSPAGDE